MDRWVDGPKADWVNVKGCRSDYRRIPQDTACYPLMLQDTFIDTIYV